MNDKDRLQTHYENISRYQNIIEKLVDANHDLFANTINVDGSALDNDLYVIIDEGRNFVGYKTQNQTSPVLYSLDTIASIAGIKNSETFKSSFVFLSGAAAMVLENFITEFYADFEREDALKEYKLVKIQDLIKEFESEISLLNYLIKEIESNLDNNHRIKNLLEGDGY